VIKRLDILDSFLGNLRKLRHVELSYFLSWEEMAQLYSLADMVLVPSRGGGFELNALEAVARGTPAICTDGSPFTDYRQYIIPVKVKGKIPIYRGNPIHTGLGNNPDSEDLAEKILDVATNLAEYKARWGEYKTKVAEEYSWDEICRELYDILAVKGFL